MRPVTTPVDVYRVISNICMLDPLVFHRYVRLRRFQIAGQIEGAPLTASHVDVLCEMISSNGCKLHSNFHPTSMCSSSVCINDSGSIHYYD